jgi:hypothetical protein
MHLAWSIACSFFFSPDTALVGQALAHAVHPLQLSATTLYVINERHTFAGHFLSRMCA